MIPFKVVKQEGAPFSVSLFGADLIADYVQEAKDAAGSAAPVADNIASVNIVAGDLTGPNAIGAAAGNLAAILAAPAKAGEAAAARDQAVVARDEAVEAATLPVSADRVRDGGGKVMMTEAERAKAEILSTDARRGFALIDPLGFEESRISDTQISGVEVAPGVFRTPSLDYSGAPGNLNFVDAMGFVLATLRAARLTDAELSSVAIARTTISSTTFDTPLLGYTRGGTKLSFVDDLGFEHPGIAPSVAAATVSIVQRDEANKAASAYLRSQVPPTPAMSADYLIAVSEGQSFSTGSQAGAAITTATALSCLMLGSQVRPASPTDAAFVPIGAATLQPLVETRQAADGTPVAAGGAGAYHGETYLSGWLRTLKARMAAMLFQDDIPTRQLVGVAAGVGGRAIAQLAKGANPEIYNRGIDAVRQIVALAGSASKKAIVASMSWSQGENDANATRAVYKAALVGLIAAKRADYVAQTGQPVAPIVFLTPPGGAYTSDVASLGVQMAFLDVADEVPGVYLVGPNYQYPDPGAHLFANSYRWHGCQIGKVAFVTQVLRQGWHPLRPRKATAVATTMLVDFLVPAPPLRFGTAYEGSSAVASADKGFRVTDATGEIAIVSVEVAADTVVKITLAREPGNTPRLWYGDKTYHNGGGQLCDSDPWQHDFGWTYPATDLPPAESIPALNNQPYPAANWCVQFCIDVAKDA